LLALCFRVIAEAGRLRSVAENHNAAQAEYDRSAALV
jgi:hypothetical protein